MSESISEFNEDSIELIVIGASAGGISALKHLFMTLPERFRIPIVVVQHFSPESTESLAEFFASFSTLHVKEVEDKEVIAPGTVYFAPANYHVLVSNERTLHLSVDAPVHYCRPSIDVLFETAAEALGPGLLAVILSGANEDGAYGVECVMKHGGKVAIQDINEAEFSIMPGEALKRVPSPFLQGDIKVLSRFISSLSEGGQTFSLKS